MIERKFVEDSIKNLEIDEYLEKNLQKADYSHTDIKVTPMSTRLIVFVGRPGVAIGKAGSNIKLLTETLRTKFQIKNPQLDIKNLVAPNLDAKVIAKSITSAVERGMNHRRMINIYLRNIMEAGAVGAEITANGKAGGARSRTDKIGRGYIKKCGDTAREYVEEGCSTAVLKAGTLGIKVKIMPKLPEMMLLEKKIEQTKKKDKKPSKETEKLTDKAQAAQEKVQAEKKDLAPETESEAKKVEPKKEDVKKTAPKKAAKTEAKKEEKPKAEAKKIEKKPAAKKTEAKKEEKPKAEKKAAKPKAAKKEEKPKAEEKPAKAEKE